MITIYDLFGIDWTVEPASLYDGEGVEGWRWYDEQYNEGATVIGLWAETPPLPDIDNLEQIVGEHPHHRTGGVIFLFVDFLYD